MKKIDPVYKTNYIKRDIQKFKARYRDEFWEFYIAYVLVSYDGETWMVWKSDRFDDYDEAYEWTDDKIDLWQAQRSKKMKEV